MSEHDLMQVEIGVAVAAAEGEEVSGDAHVVVRCRSSVLVGAIDGLGHGVAASEAAERASEALREHCEEELPALVERCHEALAGTRGAAITLARIDVSAGMLTWLGVGNVEGRLLRAPAADHDAPPTSALLLGGVVGKSLPPVLKSVQLSIAPGDTVMLATDGVDPLIGGRRHVLGELTPLADGVLHRHRRGRDDALVLFARVLPAA